MPRRLTCWPIRGILARHEPIEDCEMNILHTFTSERSAEEFASQMWDAVVGDRLADFNRLYGDGLDSISWTPEHCLAVRARLMVLASSQWAEAMDGTKSDHRRQMLASMRNLATQLAERVLWGSTHGASRTGQHRRQASH